MIPETWRCGSLSVRRCPLHGSAVNSLDAGETGSFLRADAGTRTPDPIITSDVLYQLSYVGARERIARASMPARGGRMRSGPYI